MNLAKLFPESQIQNAIHFHFPVYAYLTLISYTNQSFEGLGKISGVNFWAALKLPLIFIAPLHQSINQERCIYIKNLSRLQNSKFIKTQTTKYHLMKAICGFIFPVATAMKSLSLKENVASGFPSYLPKSQEQVKQLGYL